jgi:hypothetical protein
VLQAADQQAAEGAASGPAAARPKQSQGQVPQAEAPSQEQQVELAKGKIRELFVDYCRLAGLGSAKQRMGGLEQLLRDRRTEMQQVLGYMLGTTA